MTEIYPDPWSAVNSLMEDDYRETVVTIALRQLPAAEPDLRRLARSILTSEISIPGFRSLDRAPVGVARPHVIKRMAQSNDVVTAVICLWAEAQQPLIERLRAAAAAAGVELLPDWSWREAWYGCCSAEEVLKPIADVVEVLGVGRSKEEVCHLELAAYWLSGAAWASSAGDASAVDLPEEELFDDEPVPEPEVCSSAAGEEPPPDIAAPPSAPVATAAPIPETPAGAAGKGKRRPAARARAVLAEAAPAVAASPPAADDQPAPSPSLAAWDMELGRLLAEATAAWQTTLTGARALLSAAEAADSTQVEAQLAPCQAGLRQWQQCLASLRAAVHQALPAALADLRARPDIDPEHTMANTVHALAAADVVPATAVEQLRALGQKFTAYDREKRDLLDKLEAALADLAELQTEAGEWLGTADFRSLEDMASSTDLAELTLRVVRERLAQAEMERQQLKTRYARWIEARRERIVHLADTLGAGGLARDTVVHEQITLDDVLTKRFGDLLPTHMYLLPRELQHLEQRLSELVNEQARAREASLTVVAGQLRAAWRTERLTPVLDALAQEQRDPETLLLLLAARSAPPSPTRLALSGAVVASLWRGVEGLAAQGQAFELLNQLAGDLGSEWAGADSVASARLGLVFLGAAYGGPGLPTGFLMQLMAAWPLETMPAWQRLWEAAAAEEALPVIDDAAATDAALARARAQALRMFGYEGNSYVRVRSIKSRRHYQLLNTKLLPELLVHLSKLQKKYDQLVGCPERELGRLGAEIERLVDSLDAELSAAALTRKYEEGAQEVGIVDHERFHKTAALRVLQECGASVWEFGLALRAMVQTRRDRYAPVSRSVLLAELGQVPELLPGGQLVLDRIAPGREESRPPWDEPQARARANQQVVGALLTRPALAGRLPRVVGHLVNTALRWDGLREPLLSDLSEPLAAAAAAAFLLEQRAPLQVLQLAPNIPLELQKKAQALNADEDRQVATLQTALLKSGGATEDLAADRSLGRWPLVQQELTARLTASQADHAAKRAQAQEQAQQLRRQLNELDQDVFAAQESLLPEAYQLVEQGLHLARQALSSNAAVGEAASFYREIRYRVDHASWPLAELQQAVEQLQRSLQEESPPPPAELRATEVRDLFEQNELRRLGLRPTALAPSEVETRSDLLRQWLAVKELPNPNAGDLDSRQREAIQSMFRAFAQMISMKHAAAPEADPAPTRLVYTLWKLTYPKTSVLEDTCVLLALPGAKLTTRDLREVESLLERKDYWLGQYGWFVLLFAPGCTKAVHQRLAAGNENRGLVIIDEPTLLSIVLAETDLREPLGRLRSLLLRSRGAENVDIFRVNQRVDPRTAIFVDREAQIKRFSSGGNNYALYGGRRIGKSSVLQEVAERLRQKGVTVVLHSFEGSSNFSDDTSAALLAPQFGLGPVHRIDDFKRALQARLEENPDLRIVVLLDEIDRYIMDNPQRHVLIEVLRALADQYGSRFGLVVAGFMELYRCLKGRGPYTPSSDPWSRVLTDIGPLKNLPADQAEKIVREGFLNILGWQFETRAVPQQIVERTGGHPAFVQEFCLKLQHRVARRKEHCLRLEDIEAVFHDSDPDNSFIAYVRRTLEMNLNPVGRYIILWLAKTSSSTRGFTYDQAREIADACGVPLDMLDSSLEQLKITSVVEEQRPGTYEFSVPDYPLILEQLGDTKHVEELEGQIAAAVRGRAGGAHGPQH